MSGLAELPEFWIAAAALGLAVGSFLNVCIYRLPLGMSVFHPRSGCPACGAPIRWRHNVPVVSWLWLRARCADCAAPVSARYAVVEVLNAAAWLLLFARFGVTTEALVLLPFASSMIVLFFTDWDHKLLPNRITLPLAFVGLALAPLNPRLDLRLGGLIVENAASRAIAGLAGAAIGYGVFLALVVLWRVLFRREAMGGGDLKMMLGVGAFLGVQGVFVTIFAASVAGTLFSLPLLVFGRWGVSRELPFGCFLAPAALFVAFYGNELVAWYLGLLWLPGVS